MRWWDGSAWTTHTGQPVAVTAPVSTAAPTTKSPRRIPTSTRVGGALALAFSLSAASAGIGSVLIPGNLTSIVQQATTRSTGTLDDSTPAITSIMNEQATWFTAPSASGCGLRFCGVVSLGDTAADEDDRD
ncbi:DUF2510 domain-containing protein [Leifsonia aquatica]|uniref:DUF2510 domain-containing protein n=1 Tax=Leifsonia aquatica TaxID=144185 RepID=UPI003B8A7702